RPRHQGDRSDRRGDRDGVARSSWNAQRVLGTDRRRVFPRLRCRSRPRRPVRPQRPRRRGCRRDCHRRPDGVDHRRGTRTLPGYRLDWAGQYRYLERAKARLAIVVPLTLLIIFMLLFFNSGSAVEAAMVMLAVPFSLIGAFWLLWLLGYNMSVAVWVGLIALA